MRGNAFRLKREFERALTDYIEAMALASDDEIKMPTATGIMLVLTEGPPELRKSAAGRKAIDLMEKNFQKSRAAKTRGEVDRGAEPIADGEQKVSGRAPKPLCHGHLRARARSAIPLPLTLSIDSAAIPFNLETN